MSAFGTFRPCSEVAVLEAVGGMATSSDGVENDASDPKRHPRHWLSTRRVFATMIAQTQPTDGVFGSPDAISRESEVSDPKPTMNFDRCTDKTGRQWR